MANRKNLGTQIYPPDDLGIPRHINHSQRIIRDTDTDRITPYSTEKIAKKSRGLINIRSFGKWTAEYHVPENKVFSTRRPSHPQLSLEKEQWMMPWLWYWKHCFIDSLGVHSLHTACQGEMPPRPEIRCGVEENDTVSTKQAWCDHSLTGSSKPMYHPIKTGDWDRRQMSQNGENKVDFWVGYDNASTSRNVLEILLPEKCMHECVRDL